MSLPLPQVAAATPHTAESLLELARRGIESGEHTVFESLVVVECALDLAGDSVPLRREAVAVLVEVGEAILAAERDSERETPRHALAATLAAGARSLPREQAYLRGELLSAADQARRGWLRLALWTASSALRSFGTVVPSAAARVVSRARADSTSVEEELDDGRIVVCVKLYDATTRTERRETFRLSLRDALKRIAAPAVGAWELRVKAALESTTLVARMLARRAELAERAERVAARLDALCAYDLPRWSGGWGALAERACDRLLQASAASESDSACSTIGELERAVEHGTAVLADRRSGLAKRVRVLTRALVRRGVDADDARRRVKRALAARLNEQARALRDPNRAVRLRLEMPKIEPAPVKYSVLGPFEYPCGAPV